MVFPMEMSKSIGGDRGLDAMGDEMRGRQVLCTSMTNDKPPRGVGQRCIGGAAVPTYRCGHRRTNGKVAGGENIAWRSP